MMAAILICGANVFTACTSNDDLCFRLFTEAGFEWGGDWTTRKDYQHFELKE